MHRFNPHLKFHIGFDETQNGKKKKKDNENILCKKTNCHDKVKTSD